MAIDEAMNELADKIVKWIKQPDDLLQILESSESFKETVQSDSWPVLTQICDRMQQISCSDEIIDRFSKVVDQFISESSKKEMVFVIMECCEAFEDPEIFSCLVPKLRNLLLDLPHQQVQIDMCFGTLYRHVRAAFPIPEDFTITEEKGSEIYPESAGVNKLLALLECVVDFLQPFVERECTRNDPLDREELEGALLRLLNYPMLYLPIENDQTTRISNKIVDMMILFNPTLLGDYLITHSDSGTEFNTSCMISQPSATALHDECDTNQHHCITHMLYLVFCKNMQIDRVPSVYQAYYKFLLILPFLSPLYLRSTSNIVAQKSVQLTAALITVIPPANLHEDITENLHFRGMINFLFEMARMCNLTSVRKESIGLVKIVISKLNHTARYNTLRWILSQRSTLGPEVTGYITTIIKDEIDQLWSKLESNPNLEKQIIRILEVIYKVPDEGNTNLIGDLDFVSSALNLARYLILKLGDKVSKFTSTIKEKILLPYINPMGEVMKTHKEEMKKKVKELSENTQEPDDQPEFTMSSGGESVTFNNDLEIQATKSALNKLDLVLYVHNCLKKSISDNQLL